jgi:hypothetical protein
MIMCAQRPFHISLLAGGPVQYSSFSYAGP